MYINKIFFTFPGVNGEVIYSLRRAPKMFQVGSASGVLSVTDSLDRESTPSYNFSVHAHDKGQPPLSASALITIIVTGEK